MKDQDRILVIDREPKWRTFIVRALRKDGYTVHLCGDSQSALREIIDDNFDLIVIDTLLLNWLDTLAAERARHRLLVVTAAPSVPEAILAYRRGALDYVSKTFDASGLLATVVAVLQKQPVPQQLVL